MGRECIICRRKSSDSVTLLSFPKNNNIKNQWANFCKIICEDILINDRLCSLHFDPSAFKYSPNKNGRRLKLKPNAVPTIFNTPPKNSLSAPIQNEKEKVNKDMKNKNEKSIYLYCCLCGGLRSKIPRFSFPIHDPETTQKWLNVCGLKTEDLNYNYHKVCINHFTYHDFLERKNEKQRLLLKPGAVPSMKSNKLDDFEYISIHQNENSDKNGSYPLIKSSGATQNQRIVKPTKNHNDLTENCPSQNNKKMKNGLKSKQSKGVDPYCCLCGVLKSKIPRFMFPIHDSKTTDKWLTVCGIKKQNLNVKSHKVCMNHFTQGDFLDRSNDKQPLLLKVKAVPSVKLNQLKNSSNRNENTEKPPSLSDTNGSSTLINSSDTSKKQKHVTLTDFNDDLEIHLNDLHQAEEELAVVDIDNSDYKNPSRSSSDPLQENLLCETRSSPSTNHTLSKTKGSLPCTPSSVSPTPTQTTFVYPRYLKDIKIEDCGKSKKAKMILEIARKDLARTRLSARRLGQQNHRLRQKLKTMEETIKRLIVQLSKN